MTAVHVSLCLLLASAAGCAKTSADRPPVPAGEAAGRTEPRRTMPAEPATPAEPGRSITITGVFLDRSLATGCGIPLVSEAYLEYDSATVEPDANPLLRRVADCLTTGPLRGRKIELRGHTDPRGSDDYHQRLGLSRAQSVSDFLTTQGVAPQSITVDSAGAVGAAPDTPSDWPYERRVDIVLLPVE